MAKKVVWTHSAWTDLEAVADFISRDSPYYAAAFVREARDAARSLSDMAMRGRVVPEIGDQKRENKGQILDYGICRRFHRNDSTPAPLSHQRHFHVFAIAKMREYFASPAG